MKRIALALLVVAAACGDDDPRVVKPDGMQPEPDAMVDAPVEEVTLTSYVIDLITSSTSGMTQPRAYSEFATLPDPDTENLTAYQSLF